MAIYTWFGFPVEIIHVDEDWNEEWVWVRRDDGEERELHISDLKADGGLTEIMKTIAALPQS